MLAAGFLRTAAAQTPFERPISSFLHPKNEASAPTPPSQARPAAINYPKAPAGVLIVAGSSTTHSNVRKTAFAFQAMGLPVVDSGAKAVLPGTALPDSILIVGDAETADAALKDAIAMAVAKEALGAGGVPPVSLLIRLPLDALYKGEDPRSDSSTTRKLFIAN